MFELNKNSFLEIYRNFTHSKEDENLLGLAYAPILKADAYALYNTLYILGNSQFNFNDSHYGINELLKFTGMDIKVFSYALQKLLAIKLIRFIRGTEGKVNKYIIEVLPVASVKKFFSEAGHNLLLKREMSGEYFRRLTDDFFVKYFPPLNEKYNEDKIDLFSFFHIDDVLDDDAILSNSEISKLKNKEYVRADRAKITYPILKEQLEEFGIDIDVLGKNTDKVLLLIDLYQVDEQTYLKAIQDSISFKDSKFNYHIFLKIIRQFSQDKEFELGEELIVSFREENEGDYRIFETNKGIKIINKVLDMNTENLVFRLLGNNPLNDSVRQIIEHLYVEAKLSQAVANTIIYYTYYSIKDISKAYIEKLETSIRAKKLTSPYDVWDYLINTQDEILKQQEKKKKDKRVQKRKTKDTKNVSSTTKKVDVQEENSDDFIIDDFEFDEGAKIYNGKN